MASVQVSAFGGGRRTLRSSLAFAASGAIMADLGVTTVLYLQAGTVATMKKISDGKSRFIENTE